MTLTELHTILNNIPMYEGKVVYNAWAVGKAPKLPFICYLCKQTNNFKADNKVYKTITDIDIELYTQKKDIGAESELENALNDNNIVWEKYEDYLEDERCFEIRYEISI